MVIKFIEACHGTTHGGGNWGKFMLVRFDDEWEYQSTVVERPLVKARGWTPQHLLFFDIETGEGCMLKPGGSAHADLAKHRVWVCPLAEPFLEWLYAQDVSDLTKLPSYVELPDAAFALHGVRRSGSFSG